MTSEQYTLKGIPVKTVDVTVRTDAGACIRIKASGGMAKAIVQAITDYEEPTIQGMEEVSE